MPRQKHGPAALRRLAATRALPPLPDLGCAVARALDQAGAQDTLHRLDGGRALDDGRGFCWSVSRLLALARAHNTYVDG